MRKSIINFQVDTVIPKQNLDNYTNVFLNLYDHRHDLLTKLRNQKIKYDKTRYLWKRNTHGERYIVWKRISRGNTYSKPSGPADNEICQKFRFSEIVSVICLPFLHHPLYPSLHSTSSLSFFFSLFCCRGMNSLDPRFR